MKVFVVTYNDGGEFGEFVEVIAATTKEKAESFIDEFGIEYFAQDKKYSINELDLSEEGKKILRGGWTLLFSEKPLKKKQNE